MTADGRMVERTSRAICCPDGCARPHDCWAMDETAFCYSARLASRVFSALLPPDPAAVQQVAYETDITPETVAVIWTRMVDLSGPPPEDSGP